MQKQRFRTVKQSTSQKKTTEKPQKTRYATAGLKIKAFLTDAFMLLMPILYIVFYLVMDGREDFAAHRVLGWIYILTPLVLLQSTFMYLSGQTPGYRAYNITLIDAKSHNTPSLVKIVLRNALAPLSFATFFGWVMMFFRKDNKTLHDLLSGTTLVQIH
jgi:uncharacterized RDD family membrane protein YckC